VTVVTGPLRSGTSCITGLLERSGFDLGRNVRVLRNRTEHNPLGHFEPDLLFTINERLLVETPGRRSGVLRVPGRESLAELAGKRERYFKLFIRKFDGELCKDPLLCLTLPFWEKHWPELQRAVFCLRHPLAAARSMQKRYDLSLSEGLELWHTYTRRFFQADKRCKVFVLDFDAFVRDPVGEFAMLLDWLGRSRSLEDIEKNLEGFFSAEHLNWRFDDDALRNAPAKLRETHLEIRSLAGPFS
jgi:hypothetical protein